MIKYYADRDNLHTELPKLSYHSLNFCNDKIVIYGGLSSKNEINGNFYIIDIHRNKLHNLKYNHKNKTGNIFFLINKKE